MLMETNVWVRIPLANLRVGHEVAEFHGARVRAVTHFPGGKQYRDGKEVPGGPSAVITLRDAETGEDRPMTWFGSWIRIRKEKT